MNWLEFFFGWLTKGEMEVSMLDIIMFIIELSVTFIIICIIVEIYVSIRKKVFNMGCSKGKGGKKK